MKPKVAFICVHNACRSQIAEALGKYFASECFVSYSAGTEIQSRINQDAVRLIKNQYQIDMEATQSSKLIESLPDVDIVITMGCHVTCPHLPCKHREDWGIEDPTGKPDQDFITVIETIRRKVILLKDKINAGFIDEPNQEV